MPEDIINEVRWDRWSYLVLLRGLYSMGIIRLESMESALKDTGTYRAEGT